MSVKGHWSRVRDYKRYGANWDDITWEDPKNKQEPHEKEKDRTDQEDE